MPLWPTHSLAFAKWRKKRCLLATGSSASIVASRSAAMACGAGRPPTCGRVRCGARARVWDQGSGEGAGSSPTCGRPAESMTTSCR